MAGKDALKRGALAGLRKGSVRLSSLPGRPAVLEQLMTEAIGLPIVQDYRERAQAVFFLGAAPADGSGYEGQLEAAGRCLEWFVFDYEIPELEKTPAAYWFEVTAEALDARQRRTVRDGMRFVCSLFEVGHVERGKGFEVHDMLRPPLGYVVTDGLVSEQVHQGQLLVSRLFPYESHYLLSGMATLLDEGAAEHVKELVQEGPLTHFQLAGPLDGIALEGFLGRNPAEIHHWPESVLRERFERYLHACGGQVDLVEIEGQLQSAEHFESLLEELTELLTVADENEMELMAMMLMALARK